MTVAQLNTNGWRLKSADTALRLGRYFSNALDFGWICKGSMRLRNGKMALTVNKRVHSADAA